MYSVYLHRANRDNPYIPHWGENKPLTGHVVLSFGHAPSWRNGIFFFHFSRADVVFMHFLHFAEFIECGAKSSQKVSSK